MQRSLFKSLLRVKLPTRHVGLLFKHRTFKDPVYEKSTSDKFLNGITYCEVYRILPDDDATIMVCGRGLCKFPDRYNKKIGRKRALTSALGKRTTLTKERLFTREERELIWTAYWEKVKPESAPLHPYGPVPPNTDLITAEGQIIGGE
jgi:hypothetical protein